MHVIAMTVKVYIVMKYKRKGGIPAFLFGNRKWNDKMGKLWCFLFSVEIIDVWPASHQMPNALRGADTTSDPSLTGASVRSQSETRCVRSECWGAWVRWHSICSPENSVSPHTSLQWLSLFLTIFFSFWRKKSVLFCTFAANIWGQSWSCAQ